MAETLSWLEDLCPSPIFNAMRIARVNEQRLGRVSLDSRLLHDLGRDNQGLLIGGEVSLDLVLDRLLEIADQPGSGRIVVALSSGALVERLYVMTACRRLAKGPPDFWDWGRIVFTTPEKIRRLPEIADCLAVLVLDLQCLVHKSRGGNFGPYCRNDRPGHVNSFRQRQSRPGWTLPLLLWTLRPAKSLNTEQMLVPFGIDGWMFVRGASLQTVPVREEQCVEPVGTLPPHHGHPADSDHQRDLFAHFAEV